MKIPTAIALASTVLGVLAAPPAAPVVVSSSPPAATPSQIFYPVKCDIYACGWCHYYYDADRWGAKTPLPDGSKAETCLDNSNGRWVEPCTFCMKQPYCQGSCIPA